MMFISTNDERRKSVSGYVKSGGNSRGGFLRRRLGRDWHR